MPGPLAVPDPELSVPPMETASATGTEEPRPVCDGVAMTSLSGWRRVVTVEYLDPDDLTQVVGSDLGVKQATIAVFHNGTEVASLAVVRARAWDP